jgi:hypothetical protein
MPEPGVGQIIFAWRRSFRYGLIGLHIFVSLPCSLLYSAASYPVIAWKPDQLLTGGVRGARSPVRASEMSVRCHGAAPGKAAETWSRKTDAAA